MKIPRRHFIQFAAGGALGVLFTPVPWKVTDDIAIWTQNWSWIPKPLRGAPSTRFTACTLCPAGCAVSVRSVGAQPVSLAGVNGGLCPAGVTGHHLPWHPDRVRRPLRGRAACSPDDAVAALGRVAGQGETFAILDQRPGRTASLVFRRFLAAIPKGLYLTPAAREDAGLLAMERLTGAGPLAYDLEAARAVVSFGAPLLDGWGTPSRVLEARRRFQLVQVEPALSRTGAMADLWLPARPGTEAALAQALAGHIPAERAAVATGLPAEQIREAARLLEAHGPALAIGGGDPAGPLSRAEEDAVAQLNLKLGAAGRTIVPRNAVPVPAGFEKLAPETAFEDVPDGAIRALLIDEGAAGNSMPWAWLKRKLAPGAVVVSVAATAEGYARHADFVVPAPVYMEALEDAAPACDSKTATLAVSPALIPAMPGATTAAALVQKLAGRGETLEELLKARVEAIAKGKRGSVYTFADAKTTPAGEVADLWKAFEQGARWMDDAAPAGRLPAVRAAAAQGGEVLPIAAEGFPLVLAPFGWRGAAGPASPLYSKIYQESDIRFTSRTARINPATAREHGIADGANVRLETPAGAARVVALFDDGVMPGVVAAAIEPGTGILEICNGAEGRGWRATPARMRMA